MGRHLQPAFVIYAKDPRRLAATAGSVKPLEAEWLFRYTMGVDRPDPEGNVFRLQSNVVTPGVTS